MLKLDSAAVNPTQNIQMELSDVSCQVQTLHAAGWRKLTPG